MKVITDPVEMRKIAEVTADTDIFGNRYFPTVFFPDTATVKQMMAALYWPKGWDKPVVVDEPEYGGATVGVRVKPEYLKHLIEDTLKAGGGFATDVDDLHL